MKIKAGYGTVILCVLLSVWLVMVVNAGEKQGAKEQKVQARSAVAAETKRSTKLVKTIFYPELTKHELKIEKALNTEIACDYSETPLSEVINKLAKQHGIQILMMPHHLDEEGITVNDPVSLNVKGIPLRNALNLMLEPKKLSYVVDQNILKITTRLKAGAERGYKLRVYPVGDFDYTPKVKRDNAHLGGFFNAPRGYVELINAIERSILDDYSEISPIESSQSIVISTSYHNHIKIVELLNELRRVRALD